MKVTAGMRLDQRSVALAIARLAARRGALGARWLASVLPSRANLVQAAECALGSDGDALSLRRLLTGKVARQRFEEAAYATPAWRERLRPEALRTRAANRYEAVRLAREHVVYLREREARKAQSPRDDAALPIGRGRRR